MLHVLIQPKSLPEKYQPRPSFLDLTPLRYPLCFKDTGITFICISLDSNDDSVMRLVNVFCFSFHSAPTAKIYPRELIASSRGVRINLQKVPLFGHFRQRC